MASQAVVVVTGASSGIGSATAVALGQAGYRVALGARRLDRLQQLSDTIAASGGLSFAHRLDVTDPASIDEFLAAVRTHWGPVEVLINNAGQNLSSLVAESTDEKLRSDLEINLLGAMMVTRRVLPDMLERRRGDVVFVGSDSATRPRTWQSAYSAAKAGLEVFAKVLEMETEGTGVRSIVVRVGPTGTEFGNQMPKARMSEILESWKYWGVLRHLHWMPAESVARTIVDTVSVPLEVAYPTIVEVQPGGRKRESDH